jgi:hypothetical protein
VEVSGEGARTRIANGHVSQLRRLRRPNGALVARKTYGGRVEREGCIRTVGDVGNVDRDVPARADDAQRAPLLDQGRKRVCVPLARENRDDHHQQRDGDIEWVGASSVGNLDA